MHVSRRSAFVLLASSALAGGGRPLRAADKFVTIGINLPLTGAASEDATNILHGAQLAIEEANARGGVGGYEIRQLVLDDGTATAGQYDPAQSAINARKMIVDPTVVAAVGPQASGSGKAMAPLLSQANLATRARRPRSDGSTAGGSRTSHPAPSPAGSARRGHARSGGSVPAAG